MSNKYIMPLKSLQEVDRKLCGNKAVCLGMLNRLGYTIPEGFCLTRNAYDLFVAENQIQSRISVELGRKKFEDMRWEELWDASLRIRNFFIRGSMPEALKRLILNGVSEIVHYRSLAVRSSSLMEDSSGHSFAGLHESYINISDPEKLLEVIQKVWASLWSDAALLYRQEIGLDVQTSAMPVVIQEMIFGDVSGIAFSENPNQKTEAVIESVYGLNKGLVDGDIEPDRTILDRTTGQIKSHVIAKHDRIVLCTDNSVAIKNQPLSDEATLNKEKIRVIYSCMRHLEQAFKAPQDIEWTMKRDQLTLLQTRPITTGEKDERGWYLSLTRTLPNLIELGERIENNVLPGMNEAARKLEAQPVVHESDQKLAESIRDRKDVLDYWHQVYWEECIPFAHGVRLFGQVYNDLMKPEDPFEFVDLIANQPFKSLERNERLQRLGRFIAEHQAIEIEAILSDQQFAKDFKQFKVELHSIQSFQSEEELSEKELLALIQRISVQPTAETNALQQHREKIQRFMTAFYNHYSEDPQPLLEVARKSYRFRDDDNIYLGKIEAQLNLALSEGRRRLIVKYPEMEGKSFNAEETIKSLKQQNHCPKPSEGFIQKIISGTVSARQLRGQPAGKGLAQGRAVVVNCYDDMLKVEQNDILVCDAIDPTMTFLIPLVRGIVEQRGGMLIHGAIIAREYGIACVTGIPLASQFIQTGDRITVDGYLGIVTNHSRSINEV